VPNDLPCVTGPRICEEPPAGQIGGSGSARGYQEPFALCGSHGYPAGQAAGRAYLYASARFG
jgi:hypothetical protein